MDSDIKKNSKINVHLVGDKEIQKLNKKHLNKDYPTDVLSFNIDEPTPAGEYYIGDIIVNIDQAKRQCGEYGNKDFRQFTFRKFSCRVYVTFVFFSVLGYHLLRGYCYNGH